MKSLASFGVIASLAVALAACDGKPSAVAGRDPGQASYAASTRGGASPARDPRDLPTPTFQGKPLWAPNRNHTAEENAEYQFSRNGADFGAKSETDYVTKVHAFIAKPPHDIETLDRPNGDKLMYDPNGNVFAVVARNGAPRTMFKPRGGAAYWTAQKDQEAKRPATGSGGGSDQS
jgi:pyocin large subunit-like protein